MQQGKTELNNTPTSARRWLVLTGVCTVYLLLVLLILAWRGAGSTATDVPMKSMNLSSAQWVVGQGTNGEGQARLVQLERDGSAILAFVQQDIVAKDYPFVRYQAEDFSENIELLLVFSNRESPDQLHRLVLPAPDGEQQVVRLADHPYWQGEIVQVALAVFPIPQSTPTEQYVDPITFTELTFLPGSLWQSLNALTTAWTKFQPWTFRSINYLGGPLDQRQEINRNLVVGIVVAGFAFFGWLLLTRPLAKRFIAIIMILGWLGLDMVWQANLVRQHQGTSALFGDLIWPEHHNRMADSASWDFAQRVKRIPEADEPRRVFILGQSDYLGLRMHWHLLPLNAAHGRAPQLRHFKANDWVVLIRGGDLGVRYRNGALNAPSINTRIPASLLWEDAYAQLFVLTDDPIEKGKP